ncbi:DUF1127 domain-containing protein [Tabrizicola sp. J26]|uniref:DUF1127 domain-containing protein n=1 Tax=Alitabrizicola rongguiensis TaxID=2909234 RepID=UPI001F3B4099|nr:DUF1127 domain-containing protein [Tabrizicola rongguiensis]MCF1709595.1 DUF1127 domain-containing protein [Tabrizicola rongguiensis]
MVSTTDHMIGQTHAAAADGSTQGHLTKGLLRSWLPGLAAWMDRQETRRRQRDCYRALLGCDDHMLRDLGVTRLDVMHYLERLDGR